MKPLIGVIADDFTGAGDAASFLKKSGHSVALYTKVPETYKGSYDGIVLAQKTRSTPVSVAIQETKTSLSFLQKIGCKQIYFKYCSTFDSTPQGNIGPVLDFLVEQMGIRWTLICPSLPVNERTVKDGVLYVKGVPLGQSPMKDHPLNPMWSSSIGDLMDPQSKYPCFAGSIDDLATVLAQDMSWEHFYLVPDYQTDEDGQNIAKYFGKHPLLSGGSGLLEYLLPDHGEKDQARKYSCTKAAILCGSCSQATGRQIKNYQENGGLLCPVSGQDIYTGKVNAQAIFQKVKAMAKPVLIYSDAVRKDMDTLRKRDSFLEEGQALEMFFADLAFLFQQEGFDRIVVAGGETSGAVMKRLGVQQFELGPSIAPGVPLLIPVEHAQISLVLKSGNFGQDDFFKRSLEEYFDE